MTPEGDELIKNYTSDYLAFSYYRSSTYHKDVEYSVDTGGIVGAKPNPFLKGTSPEPWCWPIDPAGIRYVLNTYYDRYHLPMFIVENGIGLDENLDENGEIDDPFRMEYVEDHLKYVHEAIQDGCEVMGYLYWGPIDVVSAGTGEMRKRYGFVYVDRFNDGHGTLERKIKKSYYRYKEIIESNGEALFDK
jgi:6-phospho-beta-glucosidase